jgi:hypothetical protein
MQQHPYQTAPSQLHQQQQQQYQATPIKQQQQRQQQQQPSQYHTQQHQQQTYACSFAFFFASGFTIDFRSSSCFLLEFLAVLAQCCLPPLATVKLFTPSSSSDLATWSGGF